MVYLESASLSEQESMGRAAKGRLEFSGRREHLARFCCERASGGGQRHLPPLLIALSRLRKHLPLHPRLSLRQQTTDNAHMNALKRARRQTEHLEYSGLQKRPLSRRRAGVAIRRRTLFHVLDGTKSVKRLYFPHDYAQTIYLESHTILMQNKKQKSERKVVETPGKDSKKTCFRGN